MLAPVPGPARIYVGLAAPYLAQGIAYGFMGWVVLPALAAAGVPLSAQGIVLAAGGVPWVAKAVAGPLLDRWGGPARARRVDPRWVVVAASLVAASCAAAIGVALAAPAPAVALVAGLWLVHNAALAVQDGATDALVLDVVAPPRRGRAAALLLGAHHVGAEAIAALWLGALVASSGLARAAGVEAALLAGLGLAPLAVPWRSGPPPVRAGHGAVLATLRARSTWVVAAGAAALFAADQITSTASATFLVGHLRWSPDRIQTTLAPLALLSAVAGYALAYLRTDRAGHRRAALWGGALLGLAWAGFAAAEPWWGRPGAVEGLVVVQGVATAVFFTGVHASLMDATRPSARATQFVVFMAALNLPRAYAPRLAAPLVAAAGFAGTFAACGVWQILAVAGFGLALRRSLRSPRQPSGPRNSMSPNDQ